MSASLSFWGDQIPRLIEFLLNVKRIHFPNSDKINITDTDLRHILLTSDQLDRLAVEDQEALIGLAHGKITKRDVVALAYRREQLAQFHSLLTDDAYFAEAVTSSREAVWQAFFERNLWIFGYGVPAAARFMQDNFAFLDIEPIINSTVEYLRCLAFSAATVLESGRHVRFARLLVLIDLMLVGI